METIRTFRETHDVELEVNTIFDDDRNERVGQLTLRLIDLHDDSIIDEIGIVLDTTDINEVIQYLEEAKAELEN